MPMVNINLTQAEVIKAALQSRILSCNEQIAVCRAVHDTGGEGYWTEQRGKAQAVATVFHTEFKAAQNAERYV